MTSTPDPRSDPANASNAAELLVRCLENEGVKYIFGVPGEEILDLLVKGYRYKEIADALSISFETVRSHLKNIYDKMHVHSRTEAVVKYLRR